MSRRPALGLASGHAIVVPYDPRWPLLFDAMATLLRNTLESRILEIEHVGSTSVPGLAAKPVLDMLVTVPDFERSRELFPELLDVGFEYRPDDEIPDRHYFRRRLGELRTHHLSLTEPGSSHYRKSLVFRDALRGDDALARRYEALKLDLAREHPRDREAYLDGKTEFVLEVLRLHGIDTGK